MATPAHARMACPEQKTPESGDQEGSESLKNGTSLEDSDDSTGNVLVKNRVRSPAASAAGNQQHRDMTMDSFQDGGTAPQPNSRPASANMEGSFPAAMDRSRLDYQAFNQSTNRDNEDFRNSQENYNHGGGGCDMGYGRGSYASGGDQHGGQGNTSDMTTNSQSNKMYPQYNQPQMRPGYPQAPRNVMGPQQRPPGPAMSGYPTGNNSQQQRFLSGPSLSQQTGPTPTLNQLLQAPNSLQRYHNNYDYSASQGLHKNMGDPNASQYQGPNSSWGNMRGASGYPQQMSSSMYRNQGGPMPDPSMKRPYMSPSQLSNPAAAPPQGQYPQQYHPYSQTQPQGAPVRPMNQSYPQQGVQQYPGMQQHGPTQPSQMSPAGGYDHQRQQQMGSYGGPTAPSGQQQSAQQQQQQQQQPQQQPPPQQPSSQQQPTPPQNTQQQQQPIQQQTPPSQQQPPPHAPPPQQQHPPPPSAQPQQQASQQQPPQQQQQQPASQQPSQDVGGSEDLPAESAGGNTTPGLRNPTTPPHPVVSPHRPAPSPSGSSAGSPSMSPALGQQPNIPMPPRPSSNQSENSGQVQMSQPPMTAQGYNQQMAPPAMYGNKMHQNMMSGGGGGSHMAPYSPQPSAHYPQGAYHRPPSSMPLHSYGSPAQNNYPGPSYPAQSPMAPHRMPSHPSSAPSNYGSPSGAAGYNSSQYSSAAPPSTGYNMNMMPPPNQYPKSASMPPPSGGAQAAAQAAVIAAAASSGTMRQSPMYLRQHLQQKMYANNYNSAISPVPPGTPGPNGGQDTPMPPPASTPSSQPMSISQGTLPPSSASLGNASSCDGPMPASMVPAGFTQTSAPSLGIPPTTVTQSISSPVPSAVTVSSPSVPDMMQSQQVRNTMGGPQGPPPPPVMDEGSQASNASASSSLPEERVETPKPNNKPAMSHPPTPNTLPSPGAASMSSFHDEFESVSSPSWPRTPASPVINNQTYDHHPIKRPDGMLKLYDMSDDPDRRLFLDKLIMYQEERGTPLSQCPTISKQPLDLYRLYLAAKERGGFVEVMKGKMWKEIAGLIGIGASSSAAYTLRKQYIKHLLPFECKFDRGGIDPGPLISSLESNSRKKNAKNAGGPMMDGYPSPYPGGYPPNTGPHPGMMPSSEYPAPGHHPSYQDSMHHPGAMVNHSSSEGAIDPFSDEMQGSQYQQRHSTNDSYGYSQTNANSNMPPYSGNQPNVPSTSFGYSNTSGQQEPYNDQYSNTMVPPSSEANYNSRNMVPDPYAPPPGGYPPNRTVGPSNTAQYPPYQDPCNQESRYEQAAAQSPMIRPPAPSTSVIGPSSQPESSPYPPHRYPSQPMAVRDNIPPQQMASYQGRPSIGPSQYPGPNSQTSGQSPYPPAQPESYRNSEFQPQMSRLQSTLIQRLLPKNQTSQSYPASQQGMYGQSMPPPNKVAPPSNIPGNMYQRDMYGMGPKRHNEYSKSHGPVQDQYHMGNYPQQQSQGPYSDRSQYPYRPTHGVPPQAPGPPQQGWPRDSRQYSSGQGQYPPTQRDNWDISRHGEGPSQAGTPGWSRFGGPQPEPYPHHMGPSIGPKMMNRGYGAPNKMAPHGGVGPPPQYTPPSQRKEVIFPPDAVEAVTPLITKRRRLVSKDISPIEAWRIMMALKSGLLGESTWALDVLTILVHDDATVLYFGLNHLPGLLEVLMDHYRRCLNLIFDLVGDLEVGFMLNPGNGTTKEHNRKWYELECDIPNSDSTNVSVSDVLSGDKTSILDSTNYTYKTRCRKAVKTQEEEALFLFDPDKKWDVHEGFISGSSHWQHGGGEYTGYIQTQFENTERRVRFVRVLKKSLKNKSNEQENDAKDKSAKLNNISDNAVFCKKECGSDTEEDESLSLNSPKPVSTENSDVQAEKIVESNTKETVDNANVLECSDASINPVPEDDNECADKMEETEENLFNIKDESKNNSGSSTNENSESNFPKIRPVSPTRKRRAMEDLEDESYNRDEPSLCTTSDAQDSLTRRCICISSILRNLSFVPGNDTEMSKHSGFLLVMGRLLLLHHVHSPRKPPQRHYDRDEEGESSSIADSCSSLNSEHEWWWDMLHIVRENTLVTLANIAGQLDLAPFPEEISFPILDGLMHWVTCPSSYAQDPLPTQPSHSVLSPQRLSLEALSKLSVLESNVDLMMATPPWERIDRFFSLLSKWLSRNEDQVLREFSVVLLSNLSQADSSMARAIALQGTCIPLLITFVEQAEQSALQVANSQGINALRENPELMGTTLDMVRRAAGTLRCLARVPSNRTLFLQHQQRLLALVMSQILDQGVASIIADVLFECSQEDSDETPSLMNGDKELSPLAAEAAT